MNAKGLYIEKMFCRIAGKPCRVKIDNFVPKQAKFIIEVGIIPEQYGLYIDKAQLFKALREVYPEEFGSDIDKYMDRIDEAVRDEEKGKLRSEEWFEGYEAAVEVMQQSMNEITQELKHVDKG